MNTDFRITVGFFDHPKTLQLISKLGLEGAWALLRLWEFAAVNHPDGNLGKMTDEEIALAAKYRGEPRILGDALRALRWLERARRGAHGTVLHDWSDHQPYVSGAPRRREQARKAAEERWKRPERVDADSNARSNAHLQTSNARSNARSNAPSGSGSGSVPDPSERTSSGPLESADADPSRASASPPAEPDKSAKPRASRFEKFWTLYPARNGTRGSKKKAADLWHRKHLDERLAEIADGLEAQMNARDAATETGAFFPEFPDCFRWLRDERWKDFTEATP